MGKAHATSFRFSFAAERWSSENGRGRFYNNCRSVGFVRGIDLPVLCFALSLALSHGEREWVGWETPSGRETKNGSSRSVGFARGIDLPVCALSSPHPSPAGRGDGLTGKLKVAEKPKMVQL